MNINDAFHLDKTVTFSDDWKGQPFTFSAKETSLTPKVLQAFQDVGEKPIELARALADIVTDWSIDQDGKPFPPTEENLSILPTTFLWQVVGKITQSWAGKEPTPSS